MSAYSEAVEVDSPIHYWHMGEASGESTNSKGGNSIAYAGGVVYDQTGPLTSGDEGAISFDGVNDAGSVTLNLSTYNTLTVEFWLKWDANGTNDDLAFEFTENVNTKAGGFMMDPNNSTGGAEANTVSVKWSGNEAKGRRYVFARPSAEAWHHYAIVIPINGALKAYIDGAETATTAKETSVQAGNFASDKFNVMCRNGASLFGAGDMCHLALYSGELSAARILAHYEARVGAATNLSLRPLSKKNPIQQG